MVEAGVSATAVFTEVKDRQLKPFALKDSAGNPLSGVIPLNSRPVLGAGGFQVSAHHPPYRVRINKFKEIRYMEILKFVKDLLDTVESQQCQKAAEHVASSNYALANKTLASCVENLTLLQTLSNTLEPVLPPIGKVEVATVQRKITCLLKAEGCTNDVDPKETVPAIQKQIKATKEDSL